MLFWICQQIVLSIILILSLHYSYLFFKNNLTIPKTIDMIKKPVGQYKDIYNSLKQNKQKNAQKNEIMKNELKSYLKNLSTKKNNETKPKKTEISEAGNVFNTTNFSTF
jgi:hypothetical protein